MSLTICPAYDRPEEVKALFLEYTDFLLKSDPSFAAFLELQNYDRELDHLEEKYGLPKGRLYLALVDDAIAGCIALRRGQGIAEHLVEKLIDDAREMGYDAMLLDTLPFLKGALHLYAKLGFHQIPPYNNSPMETSIFLKLDLHQ